LLLQKKKDVKVFSKEDQQKFMDIIKADRAEQDSLVNLTVLVNAGIIDV